MRVREFLLSITMLFAVANVSQAGSDVCRSVNERLALQVAAVGVSEDTPGKIEEAEILIRMVAALTPAELESVDQRIIDLLSALLKERDVGVRMYIAAAIKGFGYRAESSLPALKKAYENTIEEPIPGPVLLLPSTSARHEIGIAIEFIEKSSAEHRKLARKTG